MKDGYAICLNKWTLDDDIKNELRLLLIISSLCAKEGYCFANNKYFAELFNETERSISTKIKKLENKKYISIKYEKSGTVITNREIRLIKKSMAVEKNINGAVEKIFQDNNINSINNKNINNKEIYKERFEEFYKAYPRKVDKARTEKWFLKNKPDEKLFNLIMKQLERYKKIWKNPKYIPYPPTWLNNKRWEDKFETKEEKIERIWGEEEEND